MATRQIVLDTETTGLEPSQGHRIIEIGCVELIDRRLTDSHYHQYINPEREVDRGAFEVHGIGNDFLADKPQFSAVADEFIEFVAGAELIIHNAPFDIGFLDHELRKLGHKVKKIGEICTVVDSLVLARKKHPGQKNNLDALCRRYEIDNSSRQLHGALLDSEILADVYLMMTGGQTALGLGGEMESDAAEAEQGGVIRRLAEARAPLPVIDASGEELAAHAALLEVIDRHSGDGCRWRKLDETSA